ncbi:MAG: haloacid dehalogenase-like hydrolase [Patescibacteria group bacterium]
MNAGRDWGVVFDCDGTLFPKNLGSLMKLVDDRALPPDAKRRSAELRARYLPLALNGTLTVEQERDWLKQTVSIYADIRISERQLRAALQDVQLRPGAAAGLRQLHAAGVRLGINSYGVTPLIQVALELNDVAELFTSICAADMKRNESGQFVDYSPHTFVTPDDKGEWSKLFALAYDIADEHLLAVGDSGGDRHLGIHRANRLGVMEHPGEAPGLLKHMGEVVLVADSFDPAIDWLKRKIGLT